MITKNHILSGGSFIYQGTTLKVGVEEIGGRKELCLYCHAQGIGWEKWGIVQQITDIAVCADIQYKFRGETCVMSSVMYYVQMMEPPPPYIPQLDAPVQSPQSDKLADNPIILALVGIGLGGLIAFIVSLIKQYLQ